MKSIIESENGHSNFLVITINYGPKYKKNRFELGDEPKYLPFRRFIRNGLGEILVKRHFRSDKIVAFRKNRINWIDLFNIKEQTGLRVVKDTFQEQNIQTQHGFLGYRIDLYFHDYRLTIKVDEYKNSDRNIGYKIKRQKAIKKSMIVNLLKFILMKTILIFLMR